MREIKFRAWNKKDKVMAMGSFTLREAILFTKHSETDTDNYIYLQYTGLKDKNGKEIYEGDIIYTGEYDFVVEWTTEQLPHFNGRNISVTTRNDLNWSFMRDDIEVIGNIYENPDLLGS